MSASQRPVVLVTGAARRIGAAIARVLHAAGYDIVLHYRDSADAAATLSDELENARTGSVLPLQCDLADTARLPELVDRVIGHFGRLDGLVNNASAFHATPIGSIDEDDWNTLFASNAKAPLFLSQAAAAHLRAAGGAIVNIVDIHAQRPLTGHVVYGMAKAALAAMTMSLARDLAPEIRVNGIAPGAILWPETGKSVAEQEAVIARTLLKRIGSPEDVAGAVLFLLRDAAFITGEILRVDGGRLLQ
jgi:pteridine reductase